MENVKNVLSFINDFHFSDERNSDYNCEKLRIIERRLVLEFESHSVSNLIFWSNICHDTSVSVFTDGVFQHILKLTKSLRENFMYLNFLKYLTDGDDNLDKNKFSEFGNKTILGERNIC